MRVPVDERINGRSINRRSVYPFADTVAFARARAIQSDPAVLLAYEMKHCQVSEHAPENKLAFRIERNADPKSNQRHERIQPRPAFQLIRVEIDSKACCVNVRDIYQQHCGNPRDRKSV